VPEIALKEAQKFKFEGKNCEGTYGYLRVSGKSQVDGDGPIRQEQAINDYAAAHGIEVAGIFREEGISGTKGQKQMPFPMVAQELNRKGLRTCSGTFFTGVNVEAMLRRNE